MKKYKYLVALFSLISLILIGCSKDEQYIKVQQRIGEENTYEDFKEITNSKQVQEVKDIINNINWVNAQVEMTHPADYRFIFEFKDPNNEAKAVTYNLWISPNKEQVELVIDGESKYCQLDVKTSAKLVQILVEKELTE